jgi:dipeptidyl aminopeptidase/acylaminoacyl peptidase
MKNFRLEIALVVLSLLLPECSTRQQAAQKAIPQYTIEQFFQSKQIAGGAFSSDETRLLITSNESGIYNLYEITLADGKTRQVTNSTLESFFVVDFVPGTNQMLYTADRGGNEINHLYLLGEDGSVKDLTPAPAEKATFLDWSLDKKGLYYLSNKRDPKFFDLYRIDVVTWTSKMIYRNDRGYDVSRISWDEKTIALGMNVTSSESRLFLFDVATGKLTEISDPKVPGIYLASGFSKDNTAFFYITDEGSEFQHLVGYTLADGVRKTVYATDWDVMYSHTSEKERYRVIAANADGKNILKVIDNRTGLDVDIPRIPDGDVTDIAISPGENLMRLTVGTSKSPSDIYLYDFRSRELKKLTSALTPDINPDNLVTAAVVRFRSFDSLEIPAISFRPLTASPDQKAPALVWVHGGPGGQARIGYSPLLQYLVNHGYAVLEVNNRGSSGYGKTFYKMDDRDHGGGDLKDCIAGKKYLQSLDYIDTAKIGIIGGSYGGFMTMAAMTSHPFEFGVGVDLFGVTNWLRTLRSVPPYWESFRKAMYAEMGDPYTADSVQLYDISPLFRARQIRHPVIVLQGANDVRVLKVESDEIVDAIRKNNVPVEYLVFPDEGHGFVKKENEIKGYGAVLHFLDAYLRGNALAGH